MAGDHIDFAGVFVDFYCVRRHVFLIWESVDDNFVFLFTLLHLKLLLYFLDY